MSVSDCFLLVQAVGMQGGSGGACFSRLASQWLRLPAASWFSRCAGPLCPSLSFLFFFPPVPVLRLSAVQTRPHPASCCWRPTPA